MKDKNFTGCNLGIKDPILEEFLKRFFLLFIILGLSASLIIISTKDEMNYKLKNLVKFIIGIFVIISEIILATPITKISNIVFYFLVPLIIFCIISLYLLSK